MQHEGRAQCHLYGSFIGNSSTVDEALLSQLTL
jgi:hypothetical protein